MTRARASGTRLFLAAGVLVDPETWVAGGSLLLEAGRVRAIRIGVPRRGVAGIVDLRPAVLVPGLVDAHAHLDLTHVGTVPARGGFARWIRGVLEGRRTTPARGTPDAVRDGARALLGRGTTALADHDGSGDSFAGLAGWPGRALVLREVIAPSPEEARRAAEEARRWLEAFPSRSRRRPGLAPHAPYTVSPPLYARLARLAASRRVALSTHLAETREETDLLLRGKGPLRDLLEERRRLPSGWRPPGVRPLEVLEAAGALGPRTLLVHANDLTEAEGARIARSGATVVVCPGTHLHFDRVAASVRRLRASGARLALGTDGLASNDRLDLFAEMARLRRLVGEMTPAEVFRAATLGGAALGLSSGAGTLAPGAAADFLALDPPAPALDRRGLLAWLTEGCPVPRGVYLAGRPALPDRTVRGPAILRSLSGTGRTPLLPTGDG
ncbi:MAG: amidohydrolase family protein [Planctomycetota bacterium]